MIPSNPQSSMFLKINSNFGPFYYWLFSIEYFDDYFNNYNLNFLRKYAYYNYFRCKECKQVVFNNKLYKNHGCQKNDYSNYEDNGNFLYYTNKNEKNIEINKMKNSLLMVTYTNNYNFDRSEEIDIKTYVMWMFNDMITKYNKNIFYAFMLNNINKKNLSEEFKKNL